MYQEKEGNLITMALNGDFDVITHGCNCFCTMGSGIAPQMAKNFRAADHIFHLERSEERGNINKLGQIEGRPINIAPGKKVEMVNSYTQYGMGVNLITGTHIALDYEALTLCLRKINLIYKGLSIGLPQIGAGLAGGDWKIIKQIIQTELKDMNVTIVIFKP